MEEGRGFQTLVPVISDLRFQLNKPKTGKKNATTVLLLFVAPKLLSAKCVCLQQFGVFPPNQVKDDHTVDVFRPSRTRYPLCMRKNQRN